MLSRGTIRRLQEQAALYTARMAHQIHVPAEMMPVSWNNHDWSTGPIPLAELEPIPMASLDPVAQHDWEVQFRRRRDQQEPPVDSFTRALEGTPGWQHAAMRGWERARQRG